MRRASESMKAAVSCAVCHQSCSGKALVSQCGHQVCAECYAQVRRTMHQDCCLCGLNLSFLPILPLVSPPVFPNFPCRAGNPETGDLRLGRTWQWLKVLDTKKQIDCPVCKEDNARPKVSSPLPPTFPTHL